MAIKPELARLIVAPSDTDADMLYATRIFIGDPFIFLQQKGKRILVLSDLEIDRAKKNAKADEFVMFNQLEREVQGKTKQAPPYEKVLAHFLTKRGVKRALVPANFPLGFANEIKRNGIALETSNGLFWPAREKKTAEEIRLLERALRMTETGMKRGMEILKASKPGAGKKLRWSGKTLTSETLRAEIDSAILRAGGVPANTIVAGGGQACDPHERGHGPLRGNELIILDIFPRSAKNGYYGDLTRTVVRGRASDAQRRLWETCLAGQKKALRDIRPGRVGKTVQDGVRDFFTEKGYPTEQRDGRWT